MVKKIIVNEFESKSWKLRAKITMTTRRGIIGDEEFVREEVHKLVMLQPIRAPYTVEWTDDGIVYGYMVGGK